ncbi:MAG: PilZ domain-containing protein [Armatimonadetes bacterium]|nr:PilZ domain-containing protein [Armatimonadota bacterium]
MLKDIISGFVSLFKQDSVEERRKVIRLRCRYTVFCILGSDIWQATVVDMGLQGLRLQMERKLSKGTMVSLVYRNAAGGTPVVKKADLIADPDLAAQRGVRCQVNWVNQDRYSKTVEVGVTYADAPDRMSRSWVKKILREIGFDESTIFQRRKIIRVVSSIPCQIRVQEGASQGTIAGRALNMGAGGTLVQTDDSIKNKTGVLLLLGPYEKFPELKAAGTVVTTRFDAPTRSWLHGVRFENLSSSQVDLLGKYVVSLLKASMK